MASTDTPVGTTSAILQAVIRQTDQVNSFKNEQTNVFTTTEDTATVTDSEGNPYSVPSWASLVRNASTPALTPVSVTTPDVTQYTGSVEMAQLAILISVATTAPCRVRLYPTAAERDADLSRNAITPIDAGLGQLFEGITTESLLFFQTGPTPFLYNGDSPTTKNMYYTIEPATQGVVTVTFKLYPLTWLA